MEILEIVAENSVGKDVLAQHTSIKRALQRADKNARTQSTAEITDDEKQRIAAIVELCFAYKYESDPEERDNILRTLDEIAANQPIEVPTQTIEEWDDELTIKDRGYGKLRENDDARLRDFLKKYSSLKHRAGLRTQADVAKAAGIGRTQITVLESGKHMPQQKTLQKLAAAFGVDVADLI